MQKEKILSVAEGVFFYKRYSDVKLDAIAHELDIQKPSLYHYFKNKKDLFLQVLDYSQKKYFKELDKIIEKKDAKKLIERYLLFPAQEKNIFGIASQKNYCIDDQARHKIFMGKQSIIYKLQEFFAQQKLSEIRAYLIVNLLEKLAQNNCMDEQCLNYDIQQIAEEIEQMI